MREILFRGKRLDNGEWVEGDICNHDGVISYIGQHPLDGSMVCHDLDPSTVGQYTGLKDKNGKRIWEGDIIAVPFEEDRSPLEENCIYYENGEVYFDEMRFGWYVKFNDDELALWEYDDCGVEVIGNVTDNRNCYKNNINFRRGN